MRDVIVIGGGPAGSTAATFLVREGFAVTLLERERFPRFQIGESLLPYNNDLFDRLGVSDALLEGDYFPKFGATFVTGDGRLSYSFRFDKRLDDPYRRSFQVKRSELDLLLLRNAAKEGVEVREETAVAGVDLSNPKQAVVRCANGETLEARFVIDASGHAAVLGNRVGGRADVASLKKVAFFAHYRNVARAEGLDAGNTVISVLRDGWFWLIPLTAELTSVGLVVDRDRFLSSGLDPEGMIERTIAAAPWVAERMKESERITPVHTRRDFSFRMRNIVGANYALAGDAAGFLDPIFSTGVFLAMKSGDLVAAAVTEHLRSGSRRRLLAYERELSRALGKYLRFIEHFYRPEFMEIFLQPSERWGLIGAIVGVLAGNIFAIRNNRFRLALFFALVKLQKHLGAIAPRIAWDELPAAACSQRS